MSCSCSTLTTINTRCGKPISIEAGPKEHYDFEPPNITRLKFVEIIFTAPFRGIYQLAYRVGDLVVLNFLTRAYNQAQHNHLVNMNVGKAKLGSAIPIKDLAWEIVKELASSVAKCVFFIFYVIAAEVIAVTGLFLPGDARRLMSRLDQLIYVHPTNPYVRLSTLFPPLEFVCNITAPCMQTKEIRKGQNQFRITDKHYDPCGNLELRHRFVDEYFKAEYYFSRDYDMDNFYKLAKQLPRWDASINSESYQKAFSLFEKAKQARLASSDPTAPNEFLDEAYKELYQIYETFNS